MLIVPVRQTEHHVRRWPVVTTILIVLNFVVHVWATFAARDLDGGQFASRAQEAVRYYADHPYLDPPGQVSTLARRMGALRRDAPLAPAPFVDRSEEQARLDALWKSAEEARNEELVYYKYGDRPVDGGVLTLFTSQFLHEGWLHLIFNMWFLWLVGGNIEDRWGRILFPLFYLASGVVAALAHRAAAPESTIPLIGASGAVAGVMGAFLVRHSKAWIVFWAWIVVPFRFRAPAFLMLPLWLFFEVAEGLVFGSVSSVAHWAHVGGFGFGVVVALVVWKSGLERRIDIAIDGVPPELAELSRAITLTNQGHAEEALAILRGLEAEQPKNVDIQVAIVRAARAGNQRALETQASARVLAMHTQNDSDAAAAAFFTEVRGRGLDAEIPAPMRLRAIRCLERVGRAGDAAAAYDAMHERAPRDATSFMALVAHAELLLRGGRLREARTLFEIAQASPLANAQLEAVQRGLRATSGVRA